MERQADLTNMLFVIVNQNVRNPSSRLSSAGVNHS